VFSGNTREQAPEAAQAQKPVEKKPKPKGPFTVEEVQKHTNRDDYWIIIDNKVYDVSEFYLDHPGGDIIIHNAGKDSSKGFKEARHPDYVSDMMEEHYIGDIKK